MAQEFGADLAEIARGLGRRRLLQGAALLGLAPATLARAAGVPEVVMCNWGGDAVPAFKKSFADPYEKATGGVMTIDGSGPTNGKVRAMVEANAVRWDFCDSGVTGLAELATRNLLAPIDYTVVDKAKVLPEFAYEYGVCNYMFSTVQAWDKTKIQGVPTLADFFDLKKIPGKRMVRKDNTAMIEMALLADGVPIDKIYPLDVDRAMKKFATIKDSLLVWETGAQSQSLLRDGEAVMGWLWNTRAQLLKSEPGSKIDYDFTGGLLQPGLWVVPKGNPGGKQAMVAIASMQEPAGQVTLLGILSNGPANPASASLVPPALLPIDPSSPENAAKQVKISADWYHNFHGATYRRFLEFLSS
jgi:putative spermidine/putrescine transport system substrate-binding protein